jgi:hypothetical protein
VTKEVRPSDQIRSTIIILLWAIPEPTELFKSQTPRYSLELTLLITIIRIILEIIMTGIHRNGKDKYKEKIEEICKYMAHRL